MKAFTLARLSLTGSFFLISALSLNSCASSGPRPKQSAPNTNSSSSQPSESEARPSQPSGALQQPQAVKAQASVGALNYREVVDPPEALQLFSQAKQLLESGKVPEGLAQLQNYVSRYANGQYVDHAAFYIGENAYLGADYDKAIGYFTRVVALSPPSRLRGEAAFYLAQSYDGLGRRREALETLAGIEVREISSAKKGRLFKFWAQTAALEGRMLESTLAYLKAVRESPNASERLNMEQSIEKQVRENLSESELNFLLKEYPTAFPSYVAQLRLVLIKISQGQRDQAKALLQNVLSSAPSTSLTHQQARSLVSRIDATGTVSANRIGVLVPLSGAPQALSQQFSEGLELAAQKYLPGKLEFVMADAGPSDTTAAAAFDRLVLEERVIAVVGPFSGSQAEAVAKKAAELAIPYISLSQREGILDKGPSIFRVALTPEKQVRAIVGYSKERLQALRFAILFPEDNFGREFASIFFKVVREAGAEVTAAESYDPNQSDFRVQIENMTATGFPAFRTAEGLALVKDFEAKIGRKANRRELDKLRLPPIVDFDVLFIPDTFRALGQIVPALIYADVTTPRLFGPSSWKNPRLLDRAGQYLDNALLVDWFALERQSPVTKSFIDQYQAKKGSLPSSMAALGYDVGLALALAYKKGSISSRDDLRERLENLGSFDGVLGMHDWDERRDALAEMQLFMVRRGAFQHQGGILLRSSN